MSGLAHDILILTSHGENSCGKNRGYLLFLSISTSCVSFIRSSPNLSAIRSLLLQHTHFSFTSPHTLSRSQNVPMPPQAVPPSFPATHKADCSIGFIIRILFFSLQFFYLYSMRVRFCSFYSVFRSSSEYGKWRHRAKYLEICIFRCYLW